MKQLLDKYNLNELTQSDLNELRLYMTECKGLTKECQELIKRYNRLFDMLQRNIDGIEYNPNSQNQQ